MGTKCKCIGCLTCDPVADWEAQLPAFVKHHEKVSYHLSLAQKKNKIQGIVSSECVSLLYYHKFEKF